MDKREEVGVQEEEEKEEEQEEGNLGEKGDGEAAEEEEEGEGETDETIQFMAQTNRERVLKIHKIYSSVSESQPVYVYINENINNFLTLFLFRQSAFHH